MRKAQIDYKKGVRMTENTMGSIAISDATIDAVNEKAINRNSRLYFLPHGSGISTGHVAPMAL